MKSRLLSIIFYALFSIFMLLIESDINTITKIIVIFVITTIDCIYIYRTHQVELERRAEKLKIICIKGIVLIVISALFAVVEGIYIIEKYGLYRVFKKRYICWEFLLSILLIIQIYKTMRGFSNSLIVKNKTEWFYENEEKQEEK